MTEQLPIIHLRALEPEDLDSLYNIENDEDLWDVGVTNVPYSRFVLSAYIATSVKANDSRGAVEVEDSPYGQVLVVTDHETGYALRYYRHDGSLVEDFARAGSPLYPEEAQVIAPMEVFELEKSSGLLTVVTDAGRTLLSLRSGEGELP